MAVAVMRNNQEEVNNFLKPKQFSNDEARINDNLGPVIPSDTDQVLKSIIELTAKFMKIANANPDNPVAKVLEAAVNETNGKDPKLVRFVAMNFVPHAPTIDSRVPSIVNRASGGTGEDGAAPGVSVSKKKGTSITASGSVLSTAPPDQHETGDVEKLLDWCRKDPNFNEHHEHGQMLARLYAEHLKMGIPLAKSLENYQDLILEKCKPKSNDNDNTPFGSNLKLDDLDKGWSVDNMKSSLKAIEEAIKNGFPDGSEITSNLPGATIESSNVNKKDRKHSGPSRPSSQSSDLSHANLIDEDPNKRRTCDPKCSRIDNSPRKNNVNKKDRKHNGSSRDSSQSSDLSRTDNEPRKNPSRTDNEPSKNPSRTNVIDSEPNNRPKCYHDLSRTDNDPNAPEGYIELKSSDLSRIDDDPAKRPKCYHNSHSKLQDTLQPNDFSAPPVNIRKGDIILVPSRDYSQDPNVSQTTTTEKLKGGMKFITDWSIDEIPTLSRCSESISFCGAETSAYKYPDSRPIGYPFDRSFKNNSYEETFKVHNATIKDITINWANNIPEIDVKA